MSSQLLYIANNNKMDIQILPDGKAWINRTALVQKIGVSENTIKSGVSRNAHNWKHTIYNGVSYHLIQNLTKEYQDLVIRTYGNPSDFAKYNHIREAMRVKDEDVLTLNEYQSNGKGLSKGQKEDYKDACAFLSWLAQHGKINKSVANQYDYRSLGNFWKGMAQFIKLDNIKLPTNDRSLQRKYKDYVKFGASVVIKETNTTNNATNNATKITQEGIEYLCSIMMDEDGRKFSSKVAMQQYNMIAEQRDWGQISLRTAQRILRKYRHVYEQERHGDKWFMLNREMNINQRRVSQPFAQWQLDGTPEVLWYYDPKGKTVRKLYSFKVMDSHSDYIVGYDIGETENTDVVFNSMKMACRKFNVKPYEIRMDRGSAVISYEAKSLYKNLGIEAKPTTARRARAKRVELWQRIFNDQILVYFKNKSGGNVTVRTEDSRQNPDTFKKYWKEYPTKEKLVEQLELAFALWNNYRADWDGRTPTERLNDAAPDRRNMDNIEAIESFYIWRMNGKKLRPYYVNLDGIEMQVRKRKFRYLPQGSEMEIADFLNTHINRTPFYIKYDPSDLETIALYTLPEGKEKTDENFTFFCHANIKGQSAEWMHEATEAEKEAYKKGRKIQELQRKLTKQKATAIRGRMVAANLEAVRLERLQKDTYNAALLEIERNAMLGFALGNKTMGDIYDEQSEASMKSNKKEITDAYDGELVEVKKTKKDKPLDIYG